MHGTMNIKYWEVVMVVMLQPLYPEEITPDITEEEGEWAPELV
jgi:hypothetical protein